MHIWYAELLLVHSPVSNSRGLVTDVSIFYLACQFITTLPPTLRKNKESVASVFPVWPCNNYDPPVFLSCYRVVGMLLRKPWPKYKRLNREHAHWMIFKTWKRCLPTLPTSQPLQSIVNPLNFSVPSLLPPTWNYNYSHSPIYEFCLGCQPLSLLEPPAIRDGRLIVFLWSLWKMR